MLLNIISNCHSKLSERQGIEKWLPNQKELYFLDDRTAREQAQFELQKECHCLAKYFGFMIVVFTLDIVQGLFYIMRSLFLPILREAYLFLF